MNHSDRLCVAVEMAEGAGARVRRLFPTDQTHSYDPFVLLDEFFVGNDAGFPDHPHRGFEAVTYMLEGAFRHRDNLGNDTEVHAGGVQRFSAGSGLVHSELPGEAPINHGFQLWINLPLELKQSEPDYQQADPETIPVFETDVSTIREIIGEKSPVRHSTPMLYRDILLKAGGAYEADLPDNFRGFLYVYQGSLSAQDAFVRERQALLLAKGEKIRIQTDSQSRFILVAGRPHDQPFRIRGSFVD